MMPTTGSDAEQSVSRETAGPEESSESTVTGLAGLGAVSFRKPSARTLYYFAWGVEIIAVTIGLFIALAMGYDAWLSIKMQKQVGFSDHVNVIIAALPFVLIAVVEITKIPMAGAAYKAQTPGWKIIFSLALLALEAFRVSQGSITGLSVGTRKRVAGGRNERDTA